ncbi:sulfatase [Mangrovibacterium sp.]|uniref:sulfatase n=1 Tax=Mangrovibacterium sp. TaxID=1961364 RepID=UPI0035646065
MKNNNLKFLTITTVALSLVSCNKEKAIEKPNVLFILADDLGYTDLSCMGSKYYETPNIDQIAENGMVFTNGYAACQVCSPSRASILTGKFPARHGITDWIGEKSGEEWRTMGRSSKLLPAGYEHRLSADFVTLPEALKSSGYRTFFAGKWHLGDQGSWPEDHGFDINIGGWDSGSPRGGYFSPYQNPNLTNGPDGENLEMRLASETVKFMRENKDKPFLAYLSFYAVHGPLQTTREKWEKYRAKAEEMGIAESGFEMERRLPYRLHQDNPVYAGLVESMDDAVGLVLNALKEMGLDKNTIVIFTGDNGGVTSGDAFSTNNAPLRGGKGYQWEGGIREPYFIAVPWLNLGGEKCDVPVSGTDFYPTILELAGLPLQPIQHNDGVSLLPLLKGGQIAERSLIWHYPHYGNQGGDPSSIIRKGDWKLIHYYEDDHEELYNLRNDLAETTDLSEQNPELVFRLREELFDYLNQAGAELPLKDPEYSPEDEQLYQQKIIDKNLPRLEKQRLEMLSKDYQPNNDWWGSMVTVD